MKVLMAACGNCVSNVEGKCLSCCLGISRNGKEDAEKETSDRSGERLAYIF